MLLDDPCGNGSVDRDGWDGKAEGHRGLQTPISEDLPTKNSARDPRRFLIGILIGSKEHHPYTLLHEGEKKKKEKKSKRGSLPKIGGNARDGWHRTPNGVPSPSASNGAEGQRVGTPRTNVEKALSVLTDSPLGIDLDR